MAGAGWKVFNAGAVLTAAEVNTYLMDQSVQVYAGTAARGSAVAAPAEGMASYRTDANVLEAYDGSNWVPFTSLTPNSLTNKNALINSNMEVWQRGTASTTATLNTHNFLADRWFVNPAGASCTQAQSATVPTGSYGRYSLAVTGATSTTTVNVGQRVEASVIRQYKQQVTFSAWVYNGTGAAITPKLLVGTPAASDDFTTVTNKLSQDLGSCADAAWTKVSYTFDTSGYANIANGGQLELQFASGTLNANTKSVRVVEMQLEVGPAVTPFEYEPSETTLRRCQRYFQTYVDPPLRGLADSSTRAIRMAMLLPVVMRAAPVQAFSGTLTFFDGSNSGNYSSVQASYLKATSVEFDFNLTAGMTNGRPVLLLQSGGGTMTLSAEL